METNTLHICAPLLPDYEEIRKERAGAIESAVLELQEGVRKKDEGVFGRAIKQVEDLTQSLIVLSVPETVALLEPLSQVGLQTTWDWASIWTSIKAMRLASKLLANKNLALVPHVTELVSWNKLFGCAQTIHGYPDKGAECRIASENALRSHAEALGSLCRSSRMYQGPGVASAVCAELEKYVINDEREDERMQEAQIYLYMLYPAGTYNDDSDPQSRLVRWMKAWGQMDSSVEWDSAWFGLIKRLFRNRPIDVTPFLNQLFGRAHSILQLGVVSTQDQIAPQRFISVWQGSFTRTVGITKAAKLLVEIIHVGDSMKRFEHLLMTVRTFIHPSNQGSHAERLSTFINALCEGFAKRVGRESKLSNSELTRDIKVRFVEAIFPLIMMGLNGKSLSVISLNQGALRHLSWVAPTTVANKTLAELVSTGLDPSNTRSHQTNAAMKALTVMVQPMVYAGRVPRSLIVPLLPAFLEQSVPGIDPNDTRKTVVTMMMVYAVLSCVPLVNTATLTRKGRSQPAKSADQYDIDSAFASSSPIMNGDLAPDDLWPFGPALADWGLMYLRRLFALAQARGARAKKGMSAQLDVILDYFYGETATLCLSQMDAETRTRAVKEISSFLLEEGALPDAHSEAHALARACCYADPELAVKLLLPGLMTMVDAKGDSRNVGWALEALGGLVRFAGDKLLAYAGQLENVITNTFSHKDAKVRKLGVKLLRRYSRALLDTYVIRDVAREDLQLVSDMEGSWGTFDGDWQNLKIAWHVPSEAETSRALTFLATIKDRALEGILGIEADKEVYHEELSDRQRLHHRLNTLHQIVRALLTHLDSPKVGGFSRSAMIDKMLEITAKLQPTTDTDGLKIVVKCLSLLGSAAQGPRGAGHGEYVKAYSMWSAWLREISQSKAHESGVRSQFKVDFLKHGKGTGMVPDLVDRVEPRHVMISYVQVLYKKRVLNMSYKFAREIRGIDAKEAPFKKAGDALQDLCFHPFSAVRIAAQKHKSHVDARFSWIARDRLVFSTIPRLGSLCEGKPENFTGALYLCGSESNGAKITRKWPVYKQFLEVIVKESSKAIDTLPVHRQAKAQERLAKLLHGILQKWAEFADASVPKGEMGSLLLLLSSVGNDPSVHWRRKILMCSAVGCLLSPRYESEIPRETLAFVANMAREDILPLRTVALSVIRRLMLCGESVKSLLARELSSNAGDFWHLAGSTLAEDRNSAAAEDQRADWSVGVGEFIKLVRALVRRPRFPKSRFESAAPKDFHPPKTDFWAAMCELSLQVQPDTLNLIALPTLKKLAFEGDSNKDRLIRRMSACELFAGCLAVRPDWSQAFFPILVRMLAELPSATNWCDAVLYVASFSPDRAAGILALLENETNKISKLNAGGGGDIDMDEPQTEGEKESGFSYTSNLLKVLWSLLSARSEPIPVSFQNKFERALVHPYKQVRQSAATGLAGFVIFNLYSATSAREAVLSAASKNKEGLEASLEFIAIVCGLGDSSRLLESIVIPLVGPTLFQAQGHEDLDLAKMAKNFVSVLSTIKCFSVPDQAVVLERKLCEDFAACPEWPKRRALAQFLRTFHAMHTCLLLGMGAGALVQKTAEDLLLDPQAEVREAARALLLSLLAAANPNSLLSARDRYFKMIARPDPVKKRQGVLALMALVEACPYSVPEAIPLSVLELSRHVNGTNGVLVKKTLSEFRRTHIDEWADHKKAFTEIQLNELEGVLVSPDYYA